MHCLSESGSIHLLLVPSGFCCHIFEISFYLMTEKENLGKPDYFSDFSFKIYCFIFSFFLCARLPGQVSGAGSV